MHNHLNIYYFIDKFDRNEIINLDKKISLIYRNYNNKFDISAIKKIKTCCKKTNRNFFISNNLKIALNLKLDGLYIPSFYKLMNLKNFNTRKNFKFIGSAHNISELKIKENQNCEQIFVAPIFKTKKNKSHLNIHKFNTISLNSNSKIIALGGINLKNMRSLSLTKSVGFASISWIKKNQPKKI